MRGSLLALLIPLLLLGASPATQPDDTQVQALIDQLGDLQSSIRDKATKELIARGPAARAALVEASKSPDPEISARAAMILRQAPWDRPNDPPAVRALLDRYRMLQPQQRPVIIQQLIEVPKEQGLDAVFRLLRQETEPSIRWAIVQQFHQIWLQKTRVRGKALAQKLDTTDNDPPVLCLVAYALQSDQPAAADALFLRAAQCADMNNDEEAGQIEQAIQAGIFSCWSRRDFDDVARFMRVRTQRTSDRTIAGVPESVCQLFALHARSGPLAGYADDCRQFSQYLLRPPLLYCQTHLLLRQGYPRLARSLDQLVLFTGGNDAEVHRETADFFRENYWTTPAVGEFKAFIAIQKSDDSVDAKTAVALAYFKLGQIQGAADQHLQAAKAIESGLAIIDQVPSVLQRARNGRNLDGDEAKLDLQSEMNGHYLLDAIQRNDTPEIEKRMKQLKTLPMDDPEVVQEMVAYLTKTGDPVTADRLNTPIEQKLRAELAQSNTGEPQNSLAWYLARSGRKLDEAMKLATTAVTNDPDNGAFIDTLAEVHFQMGEAAEAVKLETKALTAEPGRPELEAQMRRFQAGVK